MKNFTFLAVLFLYLVVQSSCTKETEVNQVPTVNAGDLYLVILPVDSVNLSGSASDADGRVAAYLWSQVSGPHKATIVNPGSSSTAVRDLNAGTYLFQLMATDDLGATGVDTVSVVVSPTIEKTVTLQPANNPNEVNVTVLGGQNQSYSGSEEISIDAWTSGSQWYLRGYIKFDLTSIPANAKIKTANLFLYSNPFPKTGDLVNANAGTNNSMWLMQVTSDWTPSTIGWFNQPSTTTINQINIPSTNQPFLDLNIDIKGIISSQVSNGSNYGLLLRLQNEVIYNSRIFVSSYNANYPEKRPKLVVTYQ